MEPVVLRENSSAKATTTKSVFQLVSMNAETGLVE